MCLCLCLSVCVFFFNAPTFHFVHATSAEVIVQDITSCTERVRAAPLYAVNILLSVAWSLCEILENRLHEPQVT